MGCWLQPLCQAQPCLPHKPLPWKSHYLELPMGVYTIQWCDSSGKMKIVINFMDDTTTVLSQHCQQWQCKSCGNVFHWYLLFWMHSTYCDYPIFASFLLKICAHYIVSMILEYIRYCTLFWIHNTYCVFASFILCICAHYIVSMTVEYVIKWSHFSWECKSKKYELETILKYVQAFVIHV